MASREQLTREIQKGINYALEERLAPHYERHLVVDCQYRTHRELAACLVKVGGASLGAGAGRWLDLGAGSGLVGKAIAEEHLALDLFAVDISEPMLAQIDCPLYSGRMAIDCVAGLPFDDEAFTGAFAAGLLEHIAEPRTVFRHVARVIVAEGLFIFSFPPNRTGQTALFDDEQGLVSHDVSSVHEDLAQCGMVVAHESEYPAYLNGSKGWVTHHLIACRKTAGPREP